MPPATQVDRLLELIEARSTAEVVDLAQATARDGGVDAAVDLLAAVQVEVGRRWQAREWTVADEHAATATVDVALTAATLTSTAGAGTRGTVVVSCVEDEWHVLPARMLAEQLARTDWDVVFLGASTPADQLRAYLEATPTGAVALSCTVPLHLPGARRSVAACHEAGVPALLGGLALGPDARRAVVLGADGWAGDAATASDALGAWRDDPPALRSPGGDEEAQQALAAVRPALVASAYDALASRFPVVATFRTAQQERTREDFDYILRYVESALLCDDDTVVTELVGWLQTVLDSRGLPPYTLALSLDVLLDTLPDEHDAARRTLGVARSAADRPAA